MYLPWFKSTSERKVRAVFYTFSPNEQGNT